MSSIHVFAQANELSVCAIDHNVIRHLGFSKQPHIIAGVQDQITFGTVPAQDVDGSVLVHSNNVKSAPLSNIGEFNIPLYRCLHAHDEIIPVVVVIVGCGLDTAANDTAILQRVGNEDGKRVFIAFQRHTFSGVSLHHRRFDFYARRLIYSTARLDNQRVEILD